MGFGFLIAAAGCGASTEALTLVSPGDNTSEYLKWVLATGSRDAMPLGWMQGSSGGRKSFCHLNKSGGFAELFLVVDSEPVGYARDVTSVVWAGDTLVYSTSPIYGDTGISAVTPKAPMGWRVVPSDSDSVSPDAYIEIVGVRNDGEHLFIKYRLWEDVEAVASSPPGIRTTKVQTYEDSSVSRESAP